MDVARVKSIQLIDVILSDCKKIIFSGSHSPVLTLGTRDFAVQQPPNMLSIN
jgi:hypothetical protein